MTLSAFKSRQKICKQCKHTFETQRPMQSVCSPVCGIALAAMERAKTERKEIRAAKERIKTKAEHAREAQQAMNQWIRLRDADKPCISCGRHHGGQYHAGHYRTVGSNPELRFEPLNIHKQCAPCNNHKSGDIVNYRISLVARIGQAAVAWLEGPHEPKRYTIEHLQAIKAKYRALVRDIKKTERGQA